MSLFDEALHANSKQSLEKLRNKNNPYKNKVQRFHELFKEKFSEKCGELPDEGQAQAYTETEEKQINWILHQLVGKSVTKLDGVNEIERLWEKKQTSEQEKGHPVSDKLKKTVSDIFSSWRESLGEIDNEQEVMKTQIKLDKLRSANKMKIAYNKYNKERPRITTDKKYWEERIKGSYDRVLKLEGAGKWAAFFLRKTTNDEIRQRIINDAERQERRNLYMQYTDKQREELREKKTYVLSKSKPEEVNQKNKYGILYKNSIRDVEDVLRKSWGRFF